MTHGPSRYLTRGALFALFVFPMGAQQRFIVTSTSSNIDPLANKYKVTVVRDLDSSDKVHLVAAPNAVIATQFASQAPKDPTVRSIETDGPAAISEADSNSKASAIHSTDPLVPGNPGLVNYYGDMVRDGYANQSGAALVNLPAVHSEYTWGGGIVAIIDTGIDPGHPALQRWIVPGYDFINNYPGVPNELADLSQSTVGLLDRWGPQIPMVVNQSTVGLLDQSTVGLLDGNRLPAAFGHGTMTAGLVHLAAPGAHIMPLRAFLPDGTGAISDVVRAIYFAADHGAKVINMSFSTTATSQSLADAIHYASSKGVICVASAGNEGGKVLVYPAGLPGSIGVASTNSKDKRSIFTNYGVSSAHMAAPGEALITTYPGGHYAGVWGTSFSTALVSGAAALVIQMYPHATSSDLKDGFEHGHPVDDQGVGDARLDVLKCLSSWGTDN